MFRRSGFGFLGNAVEAFAQQSAQRPAGAIARQHVEIVDVDIGLAVRPADGGGIDLVEPVIGDHLAGDVEDHAAQGIALIGIGLDAPVGAAEIFLDGVGHIDLRAAHGRFGILGRG